MGFGLFGSCAPWGIGGGGLRFVCRSLASGSSVGGVRRAPLASRRRGLGSFGSRAPWVFGGGFALCASRLAVSRVSRLSLVARAHNGSGGLALCAFRLTAPRVSSRSLARAHLKRRPCGASQRPPSQRGAGVRCEPLYKYLNAVRTAL